MTHEDFTTLEGVRNVIHSVIVELIDADPPPVINDDTRLIEQGLLTSLDVVRLLALLEQKFDVPIMSADDFDIDEVTSMGTLVQSLSRRTSERPGLR